MNDVLAETRGRALAEEILTSDGETGLLLEWGLQRKLSAKSMKAPRKSMKAAPSAKPPKPSAPTGVASAVAAPTAPKAPAPPSTKVSVGNIRAFGRGVQNMFSTGGFRGGFGQAKNVAMANHYGMQLEKALLRERTAKDLARNARVGGGSWNAAELSRRMDEANKAGQQVAALRGSFMRHAGDAQALRGYGASGAPGVDPEMLARLRKFKGTGMEDDFFKRFGVKEVAEEGAEEGAEKATKGIGGWLAAKAKKDPLAAGMGAGALGIGAGFALDRPSDQVAINTYRGG